MRNNVEHGQQQATYTAIPQAMSDSESDTELPLHRKESFNNKPRNWHRSYDQPENMPKKMIAPNHPMNDKRSTMRHQSSSNTVTSDNEDRVDVADNIAILDSGQDRSVRQSMSRARLCCFTFSIFLCFATVIIFLWVIPCDDDHRTCPANREWIKTHNWVRNYEGIELKGTINVVDGIRGHTKNLIFMYRGAEFFVDQQTGQEKQNGIISLVGNAGQVAWYDQINNEPSIIDCTLIDADRNGIMDCLIIDQYGELGCIHPISGAWLWHIADRTVKSEELLTFPLILPDLDRDGVNDLLMVISNGDVYNSLIIISGSNGSRIGDRYTIQECSYLHKFQLDLKLKISFNCVRNDTEIQIVKSLKDLYTLVTNKSIFLDGLTNDRKPVKINQHKFYGQRKETTNQRNIYAVGGKQLVVENNGRCPDDCNVSVQLINRTLNGKENVIRDFSGTRMYGMVPAILSFNQTDSNKLTSGIHGFVIKFWEWGANETEQPDTSKRSKRFTGSDHFDRFNNTLHRKTWKLPPIDRPRRSIKNNKMIPHSTSKIIMRLIKETVVLIVFNSTDIRIENTSQSNIVQFCRSTINSEPLIGRNLASCQPDLNYQENSILIADLDSDGSQELVSFYTTFIPANGDANEKLKSIGRTIDSKWKLITYVQILRLEAELPKLYSVDEAIRK